MGGGGGSIWGALPWWWRMGTHAQGDLPRTTRASPENASVPGSSAGGGRRLGGSGAGTRSSRWRWRRLAQRRVGRASRAAYPGDHLALSALVCFPRLPGCCVPLAFSFPSSGLRVFRYRVVQAGEAELPTPLFERRLRRSVSVALATSRKEASKLLVFSLKEQASSTEQPRDERY